MASFSTGSNWSNFLDGGIRTESNNPYSRKSLGVRVRSSYSNALYCSKSIAAFRNKNFTLHGQLPLETFLHSSSLLQQMFLELKYACTFTYIPGTSASYRWIFRRNFCNILNFFRFISFVVIREVTTWSL